MTMEAVKGTEAYKFDRQFRENAPVHNTILPFTRNAVGPLDYTPVLFDPTVLREGTRPTPTNWRWRSSSKRDGCTWATASRAITTCRKARSNS